MRNDDTNRNIHGNIINPKAIHSNAEVTRWYMPVIDALISLGGEAPKRKAVETVLMMCDASEEERRRKIKSGASALERTIEFARNDLREEGVIDGSQRGIWKLTELGRKILISEELAGKIRGKSIRISAVRGENKKRNENNPVPEIDLSQFYQYRDSEQKQILSRPDPQTILAESLADEELLNCLLDITISDKEESRLNSSPKERPHPIVIHGRTTYSRNNNVAINALRRANFSCEIDSKHPTFRRRRSEYQYTEPHHLIPMAYQDQFSVSLDVEENIISLCCICHKEIHYSADAKRLAVRLFEERSSLLEKAGIAITKDQLMDMYE